MESWWPAGSWKINWKMDRTSKSTTEKFEILVLRNGQLKFN